MALTTKRLNWEKWLYPGEGGLQSEQKWHLEKRRNHMKDDHSVGVSSGMGVLATGSPDKFVHVQVGRAVDVQGGEVIVGSIVDLDLSSYSAAGTTAYIVGEYDEIGTDPYIVPETSASQNKFLDDDPQITHQGSAPAGSQIELARITFTVAGNAQDATDPDNPGNNEIDMRSRSLVSPVIGGQGFGTSYPNASGHVAPVFDAASGWLFEVPAGWKVLYSSKGTLNAQLSDVQQGDKYLLVGDGGNFSLAANLTISAHGVTIRGANIQPTIMPSGAYTLSFSGNDCRLEDVVVDNGAASINPVVEWSGIRGRMSRVFFAGTDDRGTVLKLTGSAYDIVVEDCDFISDLGEVNSASFIHSDVANSASYPRGVVRNCRFNLTAGTAFNSFFCIRAEDNGVHPLLVEGNDMALATATVDSRLFIAPSGTGWVIDKNRMVGPASPTGYLAAIQSVNDTEGEITITNNDIVNASVGVRIIIGATNGLVVTVTNNRMLNLGAGTYTAGYGMSIKGGATHVRYGSISNNTIEGLFAFGIEVSTDPFSSQELSNGVTISGNSIRSVRDDAAASTGVKAYGTTITLSHNIIRVKNTNTGNASVVGVDFGGYEGNTVSGNSISAYGNSTTTTTYGIKDLGRRSVVSGNNIWVTNGSAGVTAVILFAGAVRVIVSNNRIVNNSAGTKTGIDTNSAGADSVFNGNMFEGVATWTQCMLISTGLTVSTIVGNVMDTGGISGTAGAGTKIAHNTNVATHNI